MKRILVIKIQAMNEMFRRIINGFPLLGGKSAQGQEGNVRLESDNRLQLRSGARSTRRPVFNRSSHFFQELETTWRIELESEDVCGIVLWRVSQRGGAGQCQRYSRNLAAIT